ncbi:MAG: inositol monophosphatase family protein [Acidimicrobiales bacterium]|nr:inositol monophosphatase [Actinomycetota bacterium]
MEEDVEALARLAEDVARGAGDLLRTGLSRLRETVTTKTSDTDMVSEMDHAAEELIVSRLLEARPDDSILAEEGSGRSGSSAVRWVIDPLDGTTNYLYAHPAYAVSIAAEIEGEVAVGVVADPSLDEVFTAVRGGGAFLNGEPISHSGQDDVATSLLATGFSYVAERRARQAQVLARILSTVRDIRRHGAASLDLCWVACGRVDAYYEVGLEPWDIAAGALIAAEAGALVSSIEGGPPSAASVFAAAPAVGPALLALLAEAGAP